MKIYRPFIASIAVVSLIAAGCSSDDDTPSESPVESPTETPDPPDDGNGALDGAGDDGNGALDGAEDDGD